MGAAVTWTGGQLTWAGRAFNGLETVTQATRAPADGRRIVSPCCGDTRVVYHFAWWAIPCRGCDEAIIKYEWELL